MAGAFLTDDLGTFFETDEFAEMVTWQGALVPVILDNDDVEVQSGEGVVHILPQPMITGKKSDFPGISEGQSVVTTSGNYRVKNWKVESDVIEIFLEAV